MTTVALTIAGSDPSGGAGVQSDLRTFAALGVVGVSVITAITVQNSLGVQSVHPIEAEIVAAQLDAIFSDIKVDAVKIGMLGGAAQVQAVAAALRKYQPLNIVLDPVLASTSGVLLLNDTGRHALLSELMPLCDLVTPNLHEAAILSGLPVIDSQSMQDAGRKLLEMGAKAVLVKGGHLKDAPHDWLLRVNQVAVEYSGSRVETQHSHGTGCLLSASIAANLAMSHELHAAIHASKVMLRYSLQKPVVVGQGYGYPNISAGARLWKNNGRVSGLYVLADHIAVAEAALAGRAKVIQLRDKRLSTSRLIALAHDMKKMTQEANALFIVNDRVDVALASGADGVHLGPDDMSPEDARRLLGPHKLVGVSVATVAEAALAAPHTSYFGVGAIFGSKTKLDAGEPIGVERIREIKFAFPDIPIVAIGGISLENIAEVAAAGADAAAVVSAVTNAPDIEAATRELVERFGETKET